MFSKKQTREDRLQKAIDESEEAFTEALALEAKGNAKAAAKAYERGQMIEREAARI